MVSVTGSFLLFAILIPLSTILACSPQRVVDYISNTQSSVPRAPISQGIVPTARTPPSRTLEKAFNKYTNRCACGHPDTNNCAHYVSNALINAGFSSIDGGIGLNHRPRNNFIVCRSGRPVQAKGLRNWAAKTFKEYKVNNLPLGTKYCLVYQWYKGYWGGHVAIAKISGGVYKSFRGTGWYADWPVQRYFCE